MLSPTRITLSGFPSKVSTFISETIPGECRVRPAEVFSLYHNGDLLKDVRDQVLQDLALCGNLLQTELQFTAPILSTVSGEPLKFSATTKLEEVASAILDMIFIQEVDWVTVQNSIVSLTATAATAGPVNILNYGPGLGMSPTAFRDVLANHVDIVDGSKLAEPVYPQSRRSRLAPEDIAIVGMAVDLPGASDTDALWEGLMKGMNKCTEVSKIL